ncbi:MAG: glycosyltransferase [Verrucomicrobiae bacterium]|nr:glycosyltransferase [Verrucomicrobiae bacterium]
MPRVSVIMPVYNCERYLSEAIGSMVQQSFTDFELLVLDDGSVDRSVEIARQAAERDTRITLVKGPHRGVVSCRNAGLDMAKGDLIAMMDADDIALPDRFARQVHFLDANSEYCLVGSRAIRVDSDGSPVSCWNVPETHAEIDGRHMRGESGAIINPSIMMRREVVLRIGGYRAGFDSAEDYDLFLRLAEVGRLSNLPAVLLHYRLHAKSLTFARAETQGRLARLALQDAWTRRGKAGLPPAARNIPAPASTEQLTWDWARTAFAAGNFGTARKQAFRLLRQRPLKLKRWVFFIAACLGPLALQIRRICPYRVGPIS